MKIKCLSLILILTAALILAGCSGNQTAAPNVGKAFIGGTNGLTVEFEPISVKEDGIYSIFDEDEFSLEITLRNKGEEAIGKDDVDLELLGPAKESFSGISSWEKGNSGQLEKISEFNLEGGEETVSFAEKAKYKDEVIGAVDFTWNINYRYKYKTYLIVDNVCFKEDLKDTRVCQVEEPKSFSVSSAPVTVTSVKEDSAGKGIVALTVEVKNAGAGDTAIVGEEFDQRFDQLSFEIDEPSKWECKSGGRENKARLDKATGTAIIRCKLKNPLEEDEIYSSPVKMTFSYVYQDLVKETLRIKQSAE